MNETLIAVERFAVLIALTLMALILLIVMPPWRHWLFVVCHVSTRRYLRWRLGSCTETSYGMQRPCVLWRGHATPHRAEHDARWKQASRRSS